MRLWEKIRTGEIRPRLVVGVPVGFVNVVEAKELILSAGVPCIVARGRKGGEQRGRRHLQRPSIRPEGLRQKSRDRNGL